MQEYEKINKVIDAYSIEKYDIKPFYTGENISFFTKFVYMDESDITKVKLDKREIFAHQSLNTFDFGKICIMPNGDVFANVNHPVLGNISNKTIHELLYKEIVEGKSWLRIRNQSPCKKCLYKWLCPSPSNYEIAIGKNNLCNVKSK